MPTDGRPSPRDSGGRANRPEAPAAIVVQQFVGTGGVDEPDVEVAVVIGIEHGAVNDVRASETNTARGGGVGPASRRRLLPDLRAPCRAAQHHINQPVVVEVAPQRCPHVGDACQRMRAIECVSLAALS